MTSRPSSYKGAAKYQDSKLSKVLNFQPNRRGSTDFPPNSASPPNKSATSKARREQNKHPNVLSLVSKAFRQQTKPLPPSGVGATTKPLGTVNGSVESSAMTPDSRFLDEHFVSKAYGEQRRAYALYLTHIGQRSSAERSMPLPQFVTVPEYRYRKYQHGTGSLRLIRRRQTQTDWLLAVQKSAPDPWSLRRYGSSSSLHCYSTNSTYTSFPPITVAWRSKSADLWKSDEDVSDSLSRLAFRQARQRTYDYEETQL